MSLIRTIVFVFTMLLLPGCIKLYDPQIDADVENKVVVSGRVSNIPGYQEVEVTLTSPIESPKYTPLQGCQVTIQDDKEHQFPCEEYLPGKYRVWMDQEFLQPGTSYRVRVITPQGDEVESGYDRMPKGPRLDTVYYHLEDVPTSNTSVYHRVMQFYVDLNAVGDYSRFYKWDVIETWEYHAAHPAEFYYDGTFHRIEPPDFSKMVCYTTQQVRNVFTVSTMNLSQNVYSQYPLHTIDGYSPRLAYLYSMLIRQLALSEDAYNYWERMRVNSNEQGGLYEKQPVAVKGNLVNVKHPGKLVLGYFYATSESSRRYFFKDIGEIPLSYYNNCYEDVLGRGGWREYKKSDYPVYYYYLANSVRILTYECIDCRLSGGTLIKPDFWP